MTTGDIQPNNTLNNLIGLFTGKSNTSSGSGTNTSKGTVTTTTSPGLDAKSMQDLLNSLLSGQGGIQGLAAVSSGQKAAGGYNSSTNTQLINDLLARSAAEVSKAGTGRTETVTRNLTDTKTGSETQRTPPTLNPMKSLLIGLGGTAAKNLLGPTISGIGKKFGVGDWGNDIANMLGVGGTSVASGMAGGLSGGLALGNEFAGSADFLSPVVSSATDAGTAFLGGLSGIGDLGSGLDYSSLLGTASAVGDVASIAPDAGGALWDLFDAGGNIVGAAGDIASAAAPVADVGGSLWDLFSGFGWKDGGQIPKQGYADGGRTKKRGQISGGASGSSSNASAMGNGLAAILGMGGNAGANPRPASAQIPNPILGPNQDGQGMGGDSEGNNSLGVAPPGATIGIGQGLGLIGNVATANVPGMIMSIASIVNSLNNQANADAALNAMLSQDSVLGLNQNGMQGQANSDSPDSSPGGIGASGSASDGGTSGADGATGGSGPGGDSAGAGWNNGGRIPRQPGDPRGIKDTVSAKIAGGPQIGLSGGETIIPTDVTDIVNKLAPGFFDQLIAMYHTPAAAQRGGK